MKLLDLAVFAKLNPADYHSPITKDASELGSFERFCNAAKEVSKLLDAQGQLLPTVRHDLEKLAQVKTGEKIELCGSKDTSTSIYPINDFRTQLTENSRRTYPDTWVDRQVQAFRSQLKEQVIPIRQAMTVVQEAFKILANKKTV